VTYKQFINYWNSSIRQNVYMIEGENSLAVQDCLYLIQEKYKRKGIKLNRAVFFLDEIAWYFIASKSGVYNLRIIHWGEAGYDREETKRMINKCKELPYIFIFVSNQSKEFKKLYMDNYKKDKKICFLDCSPKPGTFEALKDFIEKRAKIGEIDLTSDAVAYLATEFSYELVLSTFKMLTPINCKTFTREALMRLDLSGADQELFLVDYFLQHGKHRLLNRYYKYLRSIAVRRFLKILLARLLLFIEIRSQKSEKEKKNLAELGLKSLYTYQRLKKQAELYDLQSLYRKASLVIRLLNYSQFQDVIYFLILFW